jgi:NTP pyrophosphatase (non-canonical NTP hydrolase)
MNNMMTLGRYQQLAGRTLPAGSLLCRISTPGEVNEGLLIHGVLKLAGEAGELADLVGKWQGQGHELDPEELVKELGDVLWHVAEIATALDVSLDEVAFKNLEKLHKRYPEGFDAARSVDRSTD